jgi:hypothetical protein
VVTYGRVVDRPDLGRFGDHRISDTEIAQYRTSPSNWDRVAFPMTHPFGLKPLRVVLAEPRLIRERITPMADAAPTATVVEFPKAPKKTHSTERIWGKAVTSHGYAGVPNLLIRSQARLGLSPLQFNIVVQLLEYWHDPSRPPFPSKEELAGRMGIKAKTIQTNIRALEKAGLVRRELRKTSAGDWNSNIYHLDGLVAKLMGLEPEFAKAREERKATKRRVETPAGKRE